MDIAAGKQPGIESVKLDFFDLEKFFWFNV